MPGKSKRIIAFIVGIKGTYLPWKLGFSTYVKRAHGKANVSLSAVVIKTNFSELGMSKEGWLARQFVLSTR